MIDHASIFFTFASNGSVQNGGLDRVLRRIGQGSQDVLTVSKLPGGRHKRHTYEEIEEREEMDAKIPSTTVS